MLVVKKDKTRIYGDIDRLLSPYGLTSFSSVAIVGQLVLTQLKSYHTGDKEEVKG